MDSSRGSPESVISDNVHELILPSSGGVTVLACPESSVETVPQEPDGHYNITSLPLSSNKWPHAMDGTTVRRCARVHPSPDYGYT